MPERNDSPTQHRAQRSGGQKAELTRQLIPGSATRTPNLNVNSAF